MVDSPTLVTKPITSDRPIPSLNPDPRVKF